MHSINKKYDQLKKKYKLPDFKSLDSEFEISSIEKSNYLLRAIISEIIENINNYSKLLQEILNPDTSSLTSMHEYRSLNDEEKDKIYNLYKKLMIIERSSMLLKLNQNEKKEAEFISNVLKEWSNIKKELSYFIGKIEDSWKKETSIKEDLKYFG